jgi:hypothetical protein
VGGKPTAYDSITAAIAPHPFTQIPPEIEYTDFPSDGITAYFANDTIPSRTLGLFGLYRATHQTVGNQGAYGLSRTQDKGGASDLWCPS